MTSTVLELYNHALALPEHTEADRRTKVSRLYYALFSHAYQFSESLSTAGSLLKNHGGVHSQLSQKLTNPTVTDAKLQVDSRTVGTVQKLAHEIRIKADYDLAAEVTRQDVSKCARYVDRGLAVSVPTQAVA